jgi:DNA-binding NarL/FixJ family response regulator
VIGYGALIGPLAAHRRHGCVDAVLQLTAWHGAARFAYLPPVTEVDAADISAREADVLVLVLAGLDGPAVARRLGLSPATARAHCRAILRKLGAADRRALRARFLVPSTAEASPPGVALRTSEVCAVCSASLPED